MLWKQAGKPIYAMDKLNSCSGCQVFLSLGSNSGNAARNLSKALQEIDQLSGCRIARLSPVFYTEPQEKRNQDWFYNLAVMAFTDEYIGPCEFLIKLQTIEKKLGRNRNSEERFGPRPIDIDIILFGQLESQNQFCLLPHPEAYRRAFVLLPLFTIAPRLNINGHSIFYWLSRLDWQLSGWQIWQK